MSRKRAPRSRRCTMICATILLCYLFTCCTHLVTLATTTTTNTQTSQDTQHNAATIEPLLADQGGGGGGRFRGAGNEALEDIRIEELKHNNVHRLMSEQDLRRTFQVDSHDQVPEYEILKLTVNDDGSHLISPISDLGELTTTLTTTTTTTPTKATTTTTNRSNEASSISSQHQQQDTNRREEIDNQQLPSQANSNSNSRARRQDNIDQQPTLKTSNLQQHQQHSAPVRHKRSSSPEAAAAAEETLGPTSGNKWLVQSASDRAADGEAAAAAAAVDAKASVNKETVQRRNNHQQQEQKHREDEDDSKLIVMNLSTFGKDFKLRLRRNVDFQQRIKDMKMFMAESTKDGQLRYTEIKSHQPQSQQSHQHQEQQRKQEPHKREAAGDAGGGDLTEPIGAGGDDTRSPSSMSSSAEASTKESGSRQQHQQQQQQRPGKKLDNNHNDEHISSSSAANVWNIGSTYHDEDNLAALLIDHDRKTGQLQVDGTIGNDFVIKPMPQATIDALLLRRQQDLLRRQQQQQLQQQQQAPTLAAEQLATISRLDRLAPSSSNGNNAIGSPDQPLDLERATTTTNATTTASSSSKAGEPTANGGGGASKAKLSSIQHMHDDDPHDDDEMFLDEDEALELAHLQSKASIESNHTTAGKLAHQHHQLPHKHQHQQQQHQPPQALSKAAMERKLKKYRKLLAQTQVPKPGELAERQQQAELQSRARRHATDPEPAPVQVSHHIIYRQRPSSEGSSNEHQHSFMVSPGEYMSSPATAASMEQLASSFSAQRLSKRSADSTDGSNMIDRRSDEELAAAAAPSSGNSGLLAPEDDADFLHDPLGGQFYLEPGSVTGMERAGYSDWSFMSRRGGSHALAPPPYALNGTSPAGNRTVAGHGRRYKRQASGHRMGPAGQVRRKRQAPDTVWPEVLLVVDYDSFLLHGGDSRDVKRYFVSFWNGVDLRYKLLVHPHIRISLAGMIVAKDRDATPYLERNRLRAPNADAVDAAGALTDMGKYLYREDRLPTYDLAVVITKLDMCRRRYEGGRCNRGTAGFAYVGGACVVNKRLEKVNSVAIIEDSGGFSGIIVAAHEVGHLLGCVHDGSPPPTYLGGPGATHCPWEDGFIMSDLRHTERGFRWSQCSVEQFKHFLNGETATCLYNYPHESQMLHRLLPGTMLTLDEQCKRDRGTNACFKDARVCAQLFCFDSASGYCVSYRPAAEGSPCGEGQVCRNGKCVGEIENIIPDYSHPAQTVVARGRAHSVARLADNGLSASSTSTATSSPDNKLAASQAANSIPQLTSRMDSFPATDTAADVAGYASFGGRHSAGAVTLPVVHTTGAYQAHGPAMKAANLIDFGASLNSNNNNNNRRSGHQALPKSGAIISQSGLKPYGGYQANLGNQFHHHSAAAHHGPASTATGSALYTSASTITHQATATSSPTSAAASLSLASAGATSASGAGSPTTYSHSTSPTGGNNLLTSIPISQLNLANKNKQQQQQQLYDSQRILYQPITTTQQEYNNNNNNFNRNVNHHQPSSSSAYLNGPGNGNGNINSHRLYTGSYLPQTSVTS